MSSETYIVPQLGKTSKMIDLHLESQLNEGGIPLTKIQFVMLMVINRNGGQPQGCLAKLTGRDKTTFTRNINTLEKKKLVERTPCKDDKRAKIVTITEIGKGYLELAKPIFQKLFTDFELDISKEEKEQFLITLNKIKSKLNNVTDSYLIKSTE